MIIRHKDLVRKAKDILLEKGFTKEEIKEEYSIKLKDGSRKILDVAGIRGDEIIGIECGGLTKNVDVIKESVTEFIFLPYVTQKGNTYHCSNCDHSWNSRIKNPPKCCPKCKRYFVEVDEEYETNEQIEEVAQ